MPGNPVLKETDSLLLMSLRFGQESQTANKQVYTLWGPAVTVLVQGAWGGEAEIPQEL